MGKYVSGTIKPLEWVSDPDNDGDDWFHRAWAGEYCYEVGQDHNGWWWQESEAAFNPGLVFATPEAAKAAAQAHYEGRILAQIQPDARAEVSVAEAVPDHQPFDIPEIGNYYGGLWVKREGGNDFWSIENYDGHDWLPCNPAVATALRAITEAEG